MRPKSFMIIAGEPSGDLLAAELVKALRTEWIAFGARRIEKDAQPLHATLSPRFFGAGGPRMAEAGVELAFDLTAHAVVGLSEVLKNYWKFKRFFNLLLRQAVEREPDVIICVDFSGFNRRLAHAIKKYVRAQSGPFQNWQPKLVQYVSPQVWASREGRAQQLARDLDLLLSILPFEKEWYALRAPRLRVEFVGHPILDRYPPLPWAETLAQPGSEAKPVGSQGEAISPAPLVLLLPGSRLGELKRHLPVMIGAARLIHASRPVRFRMILPSKSMAEKARPYLAELPQIEIQTGGLAESLSAASLAIASTGTVTLECAYFGVPTVALYKTSWTTYEIAKRLIKVNFLAMPNLLAADSIYPEFIQHDARPDKIAAAALAILDNPSQQDAIRAKLAKVI